MLTIATLNNGKLLSLPLMTSLQEYLDVGTLFGCCEYIQIGADVVYAVVQLAIEETTGQIGPFLLCYGSGPKFSKCVRKSDIFVLQFEDTFKNWLVWKEAMKSNHLPVQLMGCWLLNIIQTFLFDFDDDGFKEHPCKFYTEKDQQMFLSQLSPERQYAVLPNGHLNVGQVAKENWSMLQRLVKDGAYRK